MTVENKSIFIGINSLHRVDSNLNPDGGKTTANGIHVDWHAGPKEIGPCSVEQKGATTVDVVRVAIDRLSFLQTTRQSSSFNRAAIGFLNQAVDAIERRNFSASITDHSDVYMD